MMPPMSPTIQPLPPTNSTINGTAPATTRSGDTDIYVVGLAVFLAIGACVFFAYSKKSANKEQINKQQQPIKSPKQLNML